MSPERRVSWPTTIAPPAPTRRWAVARPRANAIVGFRSTVATPRIPSVPNSRGNSAGGRRRCGDRDDDRARADAQQRKAGGQVRGRNDLAVAIAEAPDDEAHA